MKRRVNRAVARSNLTILLISLVVLIPALIIGALSTVPYFSAKFNGGQVFRAKELANYNGSLPVYFAQITGSKMIDTGYYKDSTHFGALTLGDRVLLMELPTDVVETQTSYTGSLYPMTSEYQDKVISGIETDEPNVKGVFLPFYLSVSDASEFSWNSGAVGLIIAIVGSLCGLVLVISRLLQPARHPIWKRLRRYNTDTEQLLDSIDADLGRGSEALGKVTVSRDWIVFGNGGNFNVMRVADVTWMYMSVVTQRAYGIAVGKTYSAYLWDQYGVNIQALDKEARVKEILGGIAQRAPWAEIGYSAELQKAWRKEQTAFVARIAERRKQMMRG